ncbi:MAG TPA: phosphatidate cytidylyltransferase [Lamprocystis sp. (in: g-proteobacteria)]|nr:phosphatidate cytidylyltransferase [Lamprocystis sp. (in: g-proteobacteria)]
MTFGNPWARTNSLRQRTLTALILGPAVLGAVLWLPTSAFALFLAVAILLGAWEWAGLTGIEVLSARLGYLAVVGGVVTLLWLAPVWQPWIVWIGAGWWVIVFVFLARVRHIDPRHGLDGASAGVGVLVLGASWAALVNLHGSAATGPALVLFLFLLVWIADSAAYFVGRRWGRAKLAPVLSPGKTRAGVYGALFCAAVGGILLGFASSRGFEATLSAVAACMATVAFSIVGDLYESLLKRRRGAKDSGQLLPGHGGMLDRIDSLTAAAPIFMIGILTFGVVNP